MAYQCDTEDGNSATILVTNLDNGESQALCPACVPAWFRAIADAHEVALEPEPEPAGDQVPDQAPGDGPATVDSAAPEASQEPAEPGEAVTSATDAPEAPKSVARNGRRTPEPEAVPAAAATAADGS